VGLNPKKKKKKKTLKLGVEKNVFGAKKETPRGSL